MIPVISLIGLLVGPWINRWSPGEIELYRSGLKAAREYLPVVLAAVPFLMGENAVAAILVISAYLWRGTFVAWVVLGLAAAFTGGYVVPWSFVLFIHAMVESLEMDRRQILLRMAAFLVAYLPFVLLQA